MLILRKFISQVKKWGKNHREEFIEKTRLLDEVECALKDSYLGATIWINRPYNQKLLVEFQNLYSEVLCTITVEKQRDGTFVFMLEESSLLLSIFGVNQKEYSTNNTNALLSEVKGLCQRHFKNRSIVNI